MPLKKPAIKNSYKQFVQHIKEDIIEGFSSIEEFARLKRVQTYWQIGRQINRYMNANNIEVNAAGDLYRQMETDLKIHQHVLYDCSAFARVYETLDQKLPLTWSHYRYLVHLRTNTERRKWEKRIVFHRLSAQQFLAVSRVPVGLEHQTSKRVKAKRGVLYHYRVVKMTNALTQKSGMYVDCGFRNFIHPPASVAKIENKYIYRSVYKDGAYSLLISKKTTESIYTYVAYLERIVDGDTLLVTIDCGFSIFRSERLRLKAIDAPEINTIKGRRALSWVDNELKGCRKLVVRTHKSDKYGRYLADVFYLPGEDNAQTIADKGKYLNNEMLKKGVATLYKEGHSEED